MFITNAVVDDLSAIAELRTTAFLHHAPASYSPKEVETLLADLDERHLQTMIEDERIFVMKDKEKIIGSAGWDQNCIRHVYVDPDRTREGIGSQLLLHAEQDYRQNTKQTEIHAGVALYARPFYETNGYVFVSEEKDWDGSAYYKMKKTFVPSCLRGSNHV